MKCPFLLLLALLAASCAGSKAALKEPLTYSDTARRGYERGMSALQKGNQLEAIALFTEVKRRFPYSRWATLAELRIADAQYDREQYLEAIDAYKLFIKLHPTNENVPYAQYRIALAYFQQGPDDWWFLPPSYEKDLSAIHDAVKEVQKLLKSYPGSGLVPKARELLQKCERRLADYELYVANFYADRDKWVAASMRLEYIVEKLPTVAEDPKVLYSLGKAYLKLGKRDKARAAFARLARLRPDHPYQKEIAPYFKEGAGK
jgi:outer membrane protein assembly factor BamD